MPLKKPGLGPLTMPLERQGSQFSVLNASELQLRHAIRAAAAVAAQATSEAMPEDALLFRALSTCSKFRGRV